jgi:hypothetical protein
VCDRAAHEGGAGWSQKQKSEPPELGFGERNAGGGSYLGSVRLVGVGYIGFEAVGGCHWVARKRGAWLEPKTKNRAAGARFWSTKRGGGSYLGGVDLVWVGETRLEVVGVPDELQEGEVGLVVLTFTCSFPSHFPSSFSTNQPPVSSHLHPINPHVDQAPAVFVRVALWLRDEDENATTSQPDHVRTYAALMPCTFVNLVVPSTKYL